MVNTVGSLNLGMSVKNTKLTRTECATPELGTYVAEIKACKFKEVTRIGELYVVEYVIDKVIESYETSNQEGQRVAWLCPIPPTRGGKETRDLEMIQFLSAVVGIDLSAPEGQAKLEELQSPQEEGSPTTAQIYQLLETAFDPEAQAFRGLKVVVKGTVTPRRDKPDYKSAKWYPLADKVA